MEIIDTDNEYSIDAWGRRRNVTNWSYKLDANDKALFADRGFTGHEYLPWYKLYNMNGRLYDPAVGRFLSADPVVKDPGNSQHYNRYSYCLNNPLKYTDPSGYTQADMWTNEMTESMRAALGAWATALGYTVSNGIGSSSGDGFVGSSSSTPRLDREKSTEALDVVGSLLNNPDGGYWSHSTGLLFFESNVSAVVFSGSTRNHYERIRGFQYADGSEFYYGDETNSQVGLSTTNFEQFDMYSNYMSITGMGMEALSYAAKSSANYTPTYAYRGIAQAEAAAAKFLGKMAKVTKFAGTTASVITTGYSAYKVGVQFNSGGITKIDGWDLTDAIVGGVGLGASTLAYFGIISNPIGWGIGVGVLLYGGSRSIYQLYNEPEN